MDLNLNDRVFILSTLYSALNLYYAHKQDVQDFDTDTNFQKLIPKALSASDRFEFTLVMMEFFSDLRNSHCWYIDDRVNENHSKPLGFQARWISDNWCIEKSDREGLQAGDIVVSVNSEKINTFFNRQRKYLPAANTRQAKIQFGQISLIWPNEFQLGLINGDVVKVERSSLSKEPQVSGCWLVNGEVGYIKINSFGLPEWEAEALDIARQYKDSHSLIIDVRDNNGGTSPEKLTAFLMDRPYRGWTESTPLHLGLVRFLCDYVKLNPSLKEMIGPLSMFDEAQLIWRSPKEQPSDDHYSGKLYMLIDERCRSAGEDFVQPFKENGRALLLGETTFGSTGQPWFYDFGNGIRFFIGTKRAYFSDGSPFEGIGITPDVQVSPTIEDLMHGRDAVLSRALELAGIKSSITV
jgi:carboxyl-terminal processing protease